VPSYFSKAMHRFRGQFLLSGILGYTSLTRDIAIYVASQQVFLCYEYTTSLYVVPLIPIS